MSDNSPFVLLDRIYCAERFGAVFSARQTVASWIRAEHALASTQYDLGVIPVPTIGAIDLGDLLDSIDMEELWHDSVNVGYPIVGLVQQLENLAPEGQRGYVHWGATTQDIMDTGLALQIRTATSLLVAELDTLIDTLRERIDQTGNQVIAARTHGQLAVPTTLRNKFSTYLAQCERGRERLTHAVDIAATVSMYGAGGTAAAYGPRVAETRAGVARLLGLGICETSWHTARDAVASWAQAVALLAGIGTRFAREVVALSRDEILEFSEETGTLRGASSTMPQKSNPITSEGILGMGMIVQGLHSMIPRLLEGEHERSAGEWQVEWFLFPQLSYWVGSLLAQTNRLIGHVIFHRDNMQRNLSNSKGLVLAETYMMKLAETIGHADAHELVYAAAGITKQQGGQLLEHVNAILVSRGRQPLNAVSYAAACGAGLDRAPSPAAFDYDHRA